ncbi:MAG TPA: hypothetical protein VK024_07815 [Actinomycetaceae bacterium]|nr:hypothetical protein [Actinomycetaceae bacterium]
MHNLPDRYVETMPCDPDLLVNLGRVTWASARLHSGVRDAINVHKGTPSGAPFSLTLGQAVAQLEALAKKAGRLDQVSWAQTLGRPAVNQRNAVAHAVTFTADDGLQAIGTMDHSPPGRFLDEELRGVILTLIHASMRLPK